MDKNTIRAMLPDDAVILDAGAFNGGDSVDFAKLFPNGTIIAIEPVSYIYEMLVDYTKDCSNIKTFKLALDDTVGEKTMYISSGFSVQSSALMKPKEHLTMFPTCEFKTEETVKTTTINQFCRDNGINKIDFMWLDLQGNEHKVLQNADEILHTTQAIYSEYSLVEYYEGLTLYEDFKKFMREIGFEEIHNENHYNSIGMGNSLFVRK